MTQTIHTAQQSCRAEGRRTGEREAHHSPHFLLDLLDMPFIRRIHPNRHRKVSQALRDVRLGNFLNLATTERVVAELDEADVEVLWERQRCVRSSSSSS